VQCVLQRRKCNIDHRSINERHARSKDGGDKHDTSDCLRNRTIISHRSNLDELPRFDILVRLKFAYGVILAENFRERAVLLLYKSCKRIATAKLTGHYLAASAANSSRPNAVPAIPQPPSAASVSKTQVRALRRIAGDLCNDLCRFSDETFLTVPIEGAGRS